jgi:hypothetical protein
MIGDFLRAGCRRIGAFSGGGYSFDQFAIIGQRCHLRAIGSGFCQVLVANRGLDQTGFAASSLAQGISFGS